VEPHPSPTNVQGRRRISRLDQTAAESMAGGCDDANDDTDVADKTNNDDGARPCLSESVELFL